MKAPDFTEGNSSSLFSVISFPESSTSAILFAEAELFVYITKILVTLIIAIDISVKYCINAITVSGSDFPP